MKYRLIFLIGFLGATNFSPINAQPVQNSQPTSFGIDFFINDYINSKKSGKRIFVPGVAANYTQGLSKKINWSVMLAGSYSDSIAKGSGGKNKKLLLEINGIITRKLANSTSKVQPFTGIGIGVSAYNQHYALFIPFGAGLQTKINNNIYSTLNIQYRMGINTSINSHFFYGIGLAGVIPKKASRKITKSKDKISILTRIPVLPAENSDKDHDGIPNGEDKCPDLPGALINNGCPDLRVNNVDDNLWYKNIDSALNSLAKNIYFATNSHIINDSSFTSLNSIADILKKYPEINVEIHGHTDEVGSDKNNLKLSQLRAGSVMAYLNKLGVWDYRLKAIGHGEMNPISNNTEKSLNRRVEFKIKM